MHTPDSIVLPTLAQLQGYSGQNNNYRTMHNLLYNAKQRGGLGSSHSRQYCVDHQQRQIYTLSTHNKLKYNRQVTKRPGKDLNKLEFYSTLNSN